MRKAILAIVAATTLMAQPATRTTKLHKKILGIPIPLTTAGSVNVSCSTPDVCFVTGSIDGQVVTFYFADPALTNGQTLTTPQLGIGTAATGGAPVQKITVGSTTVWTAQ